MNIARWVLGCMLLFGSGWYVGQYDHPEAMYRDRIVREIVNETPNSCWIRVDSDNTIVENLTLHNTGICVKDGVKNVMIRDNIFIPTVTPGPLDCK